MIMLFVLPVRALVRPRSSGIAIDDGRVAIEIDIADHVIELIESRLDACRDAVAEFYGQPLIGREGAGF